MRYLKQVIFFLLLLTVPQFSIASTYWIATDGVDTALRDGSSEEEWATLNYAIAQSVNDDTIKVKAGSYTLTSVVLITGITGLTITADNPSDMPVMTKTTEGVFRIDTDATHTEISYLTLDNGERRTTSYRYGLIAIDASYSYIHHNILRDGWQGVELNIGHSHEVAYNTIYNHGTVGYSPFAGSGFGIAQRSAGGSNWDEVTYIHHNTVYDVGGDGYQCQRADVGTHYVELAYNEFYNCGEDSVDLKLSSFLRIHHNIFRDNDGTGITTHETQGGIDASADNVEFYNNIIYGVGFWGMFVSRESHDWIIYNNIIYGNAFTQTTSNTPVGIAINEETCVVYNNTIFDNHYKGGVHGDADFINNAIFNNGLLGWIDPKGNGSWGNIHAGSEGTISHNYVYPTSLGIIGDNAVTVAEPMFTDVDNRDVTLLVGSPLIDAGTTVSITTDFLDAPRPFGSAYDIGVYEFGALSPSESLLAVTITSPTTESTYSISEATISLGGTAAADTSVAFVKWVSNTNGGGVATGTTTWNAVDIPLTIGPNIITVTATDSEDNTISDLITVTRLSAETSNLTNFSSYSSGVNLSDWADHWSTGDTTFFAVSTPATTLPVGTKQCFYQKTGSVINATTWTTVGDVSNVDILAKITTDAADVSSGGVYIFARVSGVAGSENGYYISITNTNIGLSRILNGSIDLLTSIAALQTATISSYVRFNLSTIEIKLKMWSVNTVEPNDWLISASDSALTSGSVGFGGLNTSNDFEVDYFGVVTW